MCKYIMVDTKFFHSIRALICKSTLISSNLAQLWFAGRLEEVYVDPGYKIGNSPRFLLWSISVQKSPNSVWDWIAELGCDMKTAVGVLNSSAESSIQPRVLLCRRETTLLVSFALLRAVIFSSVPLHSTESGVALTIKLS